MKGVKTVDIGPSRNNNNKNKDDSRGGFIVFAG